MPKKNSASAKAVIYTKDDFKKHFTEGTVFPLYVLYGEEKLEIKELLPKLVKKLSDDSFSEFNVQEFTEDSDIDRIADAALALPFMAERKCVTVTDYNINGLDSADFSKLTELIDNLSESTSLIFTYPTMDPAEMKGRMRAVSDAAADDQSESEQGEETEEKKTKNWPAFLKQASKYGAVYEFKKKEDLKLDEFIAREVAKYSCTISRQNIEILRKYVGYDTNLLRNEISKIAAFCEGREITGNDIESLATKTLESRTFDIFESIVRNNYDRAFDIIGELFLKGEEPIMINAALSTGFINMYRVRAALSSGLDCLGPREYDKKSYKLTRDRNGRDVNWTLYFSEKNLKQLNLTDVQLRQCLDILTESDMLMKSSALDSKIILQETIGKLLLAIKGENRNAR